MTFTQRPPFLQRPQMTPREDHVEQAKPVVAVAAPLRDETLVMRHQAIQAH